MTGDVACGELEAEAANASGPTSTPRTAIRAAPNRIGMRLSVFWRGDASLNGLNMWFFLHPRNGAEEFQLGPSLGPPSCCRSSRPHAVGDEHCYYTLVLEN